MAVLSKSKQEIVTEYRCAEILEAARKVFSKKGFDQTTVDDIAAAAHVAKGTIYLYFRSKRQIYFEALREGVLALHAESDRRLEAFATTAEKIRAFIRTRVEYFEENGDFFRIYYSEFASFFVPPAPAPEGLRELYLRQAKKLEILLEEAVKKGEIREVCAHSTALRVYDLTVGLIAQRLLGGSEANVEADVEALFDLVWRGIGAEHEIKLAASR